MSRARSSHARRLDERVPGEAALPRVAPAGRGQRPGARRPRATARGREHDATTPPPRRGPRRSARLATCSSASMASPACSMRWPPSSAAPAASTASSPRAPVGRSCARHRVCAAAGPRAASTPTRCPMCRRPWPSASSTGSAPPSLRGALGSAAIGRPGRSARRGRAARSARSSCSTRRTAVVRRLAGAAADVRIDDGHRLQRERQAVAAARLAA